MKFLLQSIPWYISLLFFTGALAVSSALAGPYAPAAGESGSTAIASSDASILAWATGVANVARGKENISDPLSFTASYGTTADVLGAADVSGLDTFPVMSLGDGGSITLTFDVPIADGPGADFAVFENSFSDTFLELAFVEVSSDGVNFFRFPAVSLTQTTTQVEAFGATDPTDINNLAGKYVGGWGMPFDLSELAGISPLLNVYNVTHVRIVDVIGSIDNAYASVDSLGNKVNDPWTTEFDSGGFDLDAVGVMNQSPLSSWKSSTFTASQLADVTISGDKADPDGDLVPNLLEYATGLNPLASDALSSPNLPAVVRDTVDGKLKLTFVRDSSKTDVVMEVQVSEDLLNWTAIARSTGGAAFVEVTAGSAEITEGSGTLKTVEVKDKAATGVEDTRFMRVVVTGP